MALLAIENTRRSADIIQVMDMAKQIAPIGWRQIQDGMAFYAHEHAAATMPRGSTQCQSVSCEHHAPARGGQTARRQRRSRKRPLSMLLFADFSSSVPAAAGFRLQLLFASQAAFMAFQSWPPH